MHLVSCSHLINAVSFIYFIVIVFFAFSPLCMQKTSYINCELNMVSECEKQEEDSINVGGHKPVKTNKETKAEHTH